MSRLQSAAGRVSTRWSFDQWPLRRKLSAALVLPMFLAFSFGALRVQSDFTTAQQLTRAADTVTIIRPVVAYNLAVQHLAAAEGVGGGGEIAAITKYESAAADLRIALKAQGIPASVKANAEAALGLGQAVRAAKFQSAFSDVVIEKSGNTASLLSTSVSDLGLSDDSVSAKMVVALQDTIAAQRAMTGQQVNLSNTADGAAKLRAIGQVGAETAALTRLQTEAVNSPDQVRQLLNENGRRGYTLQQDSPTRQEIDNLGAVFESSNTSYASLMDTELTGLEQNLRGRASVHTDGAIFTAALVALALLAAIIIVIAMLRSLLRPIRILRDGAREVAQKQLPDAVAKIRDGEEPPAFEPIQVHTVEEMGQLARAVDDLHSQARTLAGEQARLRVQVGHMFETLSRRSTSLIDQQLTLIERLESDEEDPKRLQSLFRLDHLAARMRRNSDSLLVLAGTTTRRGVSGALSVSDAVRAAVSEVENYERIDIGETSTDQVLGAVGSDLIHLLAEIVDNALSYSPPDTRVAIRGARTSEGGLLVEVTDSGLGMPPKELAELNDRLAHGGDITADTARRMGLFVVGSLAKRHGIAVRLRRNGEDKQGVSVSVHLPAGLLAENGTTPVPTRSRSALAAAATTVLPNAPVGPAESVVGGTTQSGLPTRVRGASGAPSTPVPGAAKKVLPTRTPGAHGPSSANGVPAPVKPVIETVNGTSTESDEVAHLNGNAPKSDEGAHLNGNAPKSDEVAHLNGNAPQQSDDPAYLNGNAPHAAPVTADATPIADADATPTAASQDAAVADGAAIPSAITSSDAVDSPAARDDGAAEATRATSGLPMRTPKATGITEYREFADAPSGDESDSRADAPTGKAGRLGWLPGRAKANAEAAARAEAEDAAQNRMPSNLSAWLDHRAKLVEAAKERERIDEGGEAAERVPESDTEPEPNTVTTAGVDGSGTDLHVPAEWVAEAGGVESAPAAEHAPEGAEAADEAKSQESHEVAPPAEFGRLARRANTTSFFGARKAREVPELVAETAADATTEPQAAGAAPDAAAVEEPVAEIVPEPVAEIVPETVAEMVPDLEPESVPEPAAEIVPDREPESVAEMDAEPESLPEPEFAPEPVAEVDAEPESVSEPEFAPEPVAEVDAEPESAPDHEADDVPAAIEPQPAGSMGLNENDTPIFRAMMSRWLTDDAAAVESPDAAWSTSEADQAWSAAARIESVEPVEESSAGLPKRRPGTYLVPGAMDEPADRAGDAPVLRRDPEAIRRSLNRHQQGVSSARTETQDGTHREEADVHH